MTRLALPLLVLLLWVWPACGSSPADPSHDGDVVHDAAVDPDGGAGDAAPPNDGGPLPDAGPDPDGGVPGLPRCGLLVNGNAEAMDLTGWTVEEGAIQVVQGAQQQYPDAYEGSFAFFAGASAQSVASQTVDVSANASVIDAGGVYAALTGWVRTWDGTDRAFLRVAALDGSQVELASAQLGPYRDDQWTKRVVAFALPAGTRAVVATLRGEREQGTDNDAYFDALDLCLTADPPPPADDEFLTPVYLMWATEEGVSVRWETATPTVGRVEYGLTPALGSVETEPTAVTVHEVRLAGLPAGQVVYYRVAWEGVFGEVHDFVTAPPAGNTTPFTFLVWGDNQDGTGVFEGLITHMLAEGASFAWSVGDTVSGGTRDNYRGQILGPISALADHVPFLVAAGNHERYTDTNAALFDEYYSQPDAGRLPEHCFGWVWGPIYFVAIDSDLSIDVGSDQRACIDAAFSSAEATAAAFRVALFHKPPRIEWWYGGTVAFTEEMEAPWIREVLEPQLESLDVHLVFNGHNHLYAYTPMTAGGITFATTGGGGGGLDTNLFLWHVATWSEITVTLHENHYLRVQATPSLLSVDAVGTSGQVIHSFQVSP